MDLVFRMVCLGVLVFVAGEPRQAPPVLHSGDVVLQTSQSSRSALIQRASGSKYSHVGLVEVAPDGVYVLEAISPVSRTRFDRWAARGQGRAVTVLRPVGLDAVALQRVVDVARAQLGKPYDARYRWDDEALYCSELVVKAFWRGAQVELGTRQRVADLSLSLPERTLAHALGIADEQELVTPGSLDGDAHLTVVARDLRWP